MKSKITQWDAEKINDTFEDVPVGSMIIKIKDKIQVMNVNYWQYDNCSLDNFYGTMYKITAELLKDDNGMVIAEITVPEPTLAEQLYRIAEPDGKEWHLVSDKKAARYERLAEHSKL